MSIANVAVRFVMEQPAVAGVIVGARPGERSHLEDNLRLFDFSLDERARRELAEAQAALDPIPGDCGDEYRRPPYLTASGDLHHHVTHFPAPYGVQETERGTELIPEAGFTEAVRTGNRIRICGVPPIHGGRVIGGGDVRAQTHFALDRAEGALQSLGADPADIVRIAVRAPAEDWPAIGAVVRERLPSAPDPGRAAGRPPSAYRVEIDMEARTRS